MDGGNLLFTVESNSHKKSDVDLITAHGILRAYKQMGYDAIGVSGSDLLAGYDFFKHAYIPEYPLVSANVYDNEGQRFFRPHIIKRLGAATIGIIGLTGDSANKKLENLVIDDWRRSLENELGVILPDCDIIIVLSSLNEKNNIVLQELFPQVDIVITANPRSSNLVPKVLGHSLMSQSGKRGKYLGKLDLEYHKNGNWIKKGPNKLEKLQNKLKTTEWYIKEFTKQHSDQAKAEEDARISKLKISREKISQQIHSLSSDDKWMKQQPPNSFSSRFMPIIPSKGPESIEKTVLEISQSINRYNKQKQQSLKSGDQPPNKILLTDAIAGYQVCSTCHEKQYLFWQDTQHSTSYGTLYERGQAHNLSCLPCHVTSGLIKDTSPELDKEQLLILDQQRLTVGCESCHGPAKSHAESPDMNNPEPKVSETVCLSCHTPERDYNFDYSEKLPKIRCPSE